MMNIFHKKTGQVNGESQEGRFRSFTFEGREFKLRRISERLIHVTHRDMEGWIGVLDDKHWDALSPFAHASRETAVSSEGINDGLWSFNSPDAALKSLCRVMTMEQEKVDASTINPQEKKAAAVTVLGEFFDELAECPE